MKLAVVGSREGISKEYVFSVLDEYKGEISMVVSGGARGVDSFAAEWCDLNEVACTLVSPSDFSSKFSYIERNWRIVDLSDKVLVFWDGVSRGTKSVIDYCKKKDKDISLFVFAKKGDDVGN